jgi:signal transduction histidine kinase
MCGDRFPPMWVKRDFSNAQRDRGSHMKLYLASLTPQIRILCEEVFREIPNQEWTLQIANTGSAPAALDADLYLWDVEHAVAPFDTIAPRDTWRHFFLVDRTRLQQFRELIPFEGAQILLKPVTKAALTVFLTDACKRCGRNAPMTTDALVEGLRADRDELLQCLMQANLKLQEYDHDRTNFLARAIHDFRAPLTAVTGYCGLLLGEDIGTLTEDQREVLERMHHSAKKLSRMASAMFQLSIAPHVEASISLQSGEIRDCVDHALNEVLPTADEKRLTITVDTAPAPDTLYFEKGKLEQVLLNLLDNACKFTPRGGTIEIKGYPYYWDNRLGMDADMGAGSDSRRGMRRSANSYRLDIKDTGPGIPPVHLTKVFEEYTSYGGGVDRSGGGLGLAICRMIVNQHKGCIWAESSKDGGVFSFVLPFHSGSGLLDQQNSNTLHAGAL